MTGARRLEIFAMPAAVCCSGLLVLWFSGQITGLLAATTLVFFLRGMGSGLLSVGICGIAAGLFFFVIGPAGGMLATLALFFPISIGVGLIVHAKSQDAAEGSEHKARLIAESMPGIGWATDANGKHTYVAESVWDYIGADSKNRIQGSDTFAWHSLVHPDDLDHVVRQWAHSRQTGHNYEAEYRLRRFDGIYRYYHAVGAPSRNSEGEIVGWYGTTFDVDNRRRAEETLKSSEANFRAILDNIPGMIATANSEGRHDYASQRSLDYFNITLSDLAGLGFLNIIHPDEREAVGKTWLHSVQTKTPMDILHRLRRYDGEYRWFHARVEPAFNDQGTVDRWYGLITDVHDREQAQEALHARQRELQLLVDAVPSLIWVIEPDGEPAYINKRLETYYGRNIDFTENDGGSRLARALEHLIHPDDLDAVKSSLAHSLRTGASYAMKYRNRRADGDFRWVEARADPLRGEDGRIVKWYGVSIDIDNEVRAQEALRATQEKLSRAAQIASLAELSASIAHEVNQPLAAVITNSYACQHWLSASPPNLGRARITSERIVRDANAAADVISRIRDLFAHKASVRGLVSVNSVIEEVRQHLADRLVADKITFETHLDHSLPPVLADRVQIHQIIINLIRNAIDAMQRNHDLPKYIFVASRRDGRNAIQVEVRDNGEGISEADRIFEPFFTTKEDGMGMGLAICRSILESHGGRMWVQNESPRGSSFLFALPILADEII